MDFLAGPYTIEVSAADTSGNTGTDSVDVELIKLLSDCFGTLGDEDFEGDPEPETGFTGCRLTDLANVQAPPDTAVCDVQDPPAECFIAGKLLKPDPGKVADLASQGCDACVPNYCGEYGFPDPRMEQLVNGRWVPQQPLTELVVFQELGGAPAPDSLPPGSTPATALVLDKYTYGFEGCFVVAQHVKGAFLDILYPFWPQNPATGLVFIKTHFPEDVLPVDQVAKCYGAGGNFDLQDAGGAGYVPLDQLLTVEDERTEDGIGTVFVATQKCVNPARTLTRNNGFDVSNIVETAGIDFASNPEEVLDFKYQLADMKFDALFTALANAQPTLLTGKFSDVSSPVNQAKSQFLNRKRQSLTRAIRDLEEAADAIRTKTTWLVTEANWPGDALARIENLIWRIKMLREELTRL